MKPFDHALWKSCFGAGWSPLVDLIGDYLEQYEPAIYRGESPFGLKEKYARLRSEPWGVQNQSTYDYLDLVERFSGYVCEQCGDQGEPHLNRGWWKTLCPKHRDIDRVDSNPPYEEGQRA